MAPQSFHLHFEEAHQAAPHQELKRAWFFQGAGFATLMLIGVYSMGGLQFRRSSCKSFADWSLVHGCEKPSGHEAAFAFVPAVRNGGLRAQQAQRPSQTAGRGAAEMLRMSTYAEYQASLNRNVAVPFEPAASVPVHTGEGKGFGGGEATRDPKPTVIDPNDPKAKINAIHPAESFAEYMAKRDGSAVAADNSQARPVITISEDIACSAEEDLSACIAKARQVTVSDDIACPIEDDLKACIQRAMGANAIKPAQTFEEYMNTRGGMKSPLAPQWTPPSTSGNEGQSAPVAAVSEDAAKAAWLAKQEASPWAPYGGAAARAAAAPVVATAPVAAAAPVPAVAPSASAITEEAAKASWLASQDAPWGRGAAAPVSSAASAAVAPVPVHTGEGKGFGGGEATRDPKPTVIDPNDPKAKVNAIHPADSFADYMAKRNAGR